MFSGCVDVVIYCDKVWVVLVGIGYEECESKLDRCFWIDGWNGNRDWLLGVCYYNRGRVW